MLSNCGHDEYGRYSGGKAGDQSGTEWYICDWYYYGDGGWNYVLRHPDPTVRHYISEFAIQAAHNDNIGYDQCERYTFWQQLASSGYFPMYISTPCEADCSSGVLSIVKAVGYVLNRPELQNVSIYGWTGNERRLLEAAGFITLADVEYLTSDNYLLGGDILLNEENHTCICVSDGSEAVDPAYDDCFLFRTESIGKGAEGINVWRGQMILRSRGLYSGEIDSIFGADTEKAVYDFQKLAGIRQTGRLDLDTWATLIGLPRKDGYWVASPCCIGFVANKTVLLGQEFLKASGYYDGPLTWTFDEKLREGVIEFQKAAAQITDTIEVNGKLDKPTLRWMVGED